MQNRDVKQFYNSTMPGKFGDDYEHNRWFKDEIQRVGYVQTRDAIMHHILSDDSLLPTRILELGPGAGTWTKILIARFPDAYIDLLDISKEMLARSKKAIGENAHVSFNESDILEWVPEGTYDFFFSSRVLEYIDDKQAFCTKIFSFLRPGGRGFLITKMPHYKRERFLGRRMGGLHQGQIVPGALRDELHRAGFIDVDCYPVTMSVPLLHSPKANIWMSKIFDRWTLGLVGMFFAESYCVIFRKSLK